MTLKQVAGRLKVTIPAVIAVEKGRRATGDNIARKLADAFELPVHERSDFMQMSVATRLRDRLTGVAGRVPPEVTHCVVNLLRQSGVDPADIRRVDVGKWSGKTSEGSVLEIELHDGKKAICTLCVSV